MGFLEEGAITACHVERSTVKGQYRAGGLVGENADGKIVDSHADASVSGASDVGGLTGLNSGQISTCFSTGDVEGDRGVGGGLAGSNAGIVTHCYSRSRVGGKSHMGGLVGWNEGGTVSCCFSAGLVSGNGDYVGGLIGCMSSGSVEASFWDMEASRQLTSADGMGRMTEQMRAAATFLGAGWDFVDESANGTEGIWWMSESPDYPHLRWERSDDDFSASGDT